MTWGVASSSDFSFGVRRGRKITASLIFRILSSGAGPLGLRLILSVLQQPHLPQACTGDAGALSGDQNINQMGTRL